MTFMKKFLNIIFALAIFASFAGFSAAQSRREHLTEMEIERVQDAQELDRRTEVFIHAAERRLYALEPANAEFKKKTEKEIDDWGELPKGTRAAIITDIANIFAEAMRNLDEVYRRDEKNKMIAKSLRRLADSSAEIQPKLAAIREQTKDQKEINAVERVESEFDAVKEAARQLPPPDKDEKKKKSKN